MEFAKIKAEIRKVNPETTRVNNENYFEAVIAQANIAGMIGLLESIFGAPAWPSDKELGKDIEKLIDRVGGLREGQKLYFLNEEECSAFAMLWPWQDGERTTIKMSSI